MKKQLTLALLVLTSSLTLALALPGRYLATPSENHQKECARCHGPEGRGDGPGAVLLTVKPANWTDPGRMGAISDEDLFKVIKYGGDSVDKSKLMPSFGIKLNDEEISELVKYIRALSQ